MKKALSLTLTVFCAILLSTSIQSCYRYNEQSLYGSTVTTCDTAGVKYSTTVTNIIAPQCATSGCHNASSASAGCNLSSYATTKTYITNNKDFFLGSINYTAGYSKMPKGGSQLSACDRTKITNWINAGMPNN